MCVICEEDTNHSEHFCCGRNNLRLPHADEFAQFHNKLFLIRLQSWLVVAVPIVRRCFDGNGVPRGRTCVGLSLRERKTTCATHE